MPIVMFSFGFLFKNSFILLDKSYRQAPQRTVPVTCKPLEHISQGKYLLMTLLSEMSLE